MTSEVMPNFLRWHPDYGIGVEEVDREHQRLFSFVEALASATQAGSRQSELEEVIGQLLSYTLYHFDREEELMRNIGYPFLADHQREHMALRQRVQEIRSRSEAGDVAVATDLANLIAAWLKCHTTTTDRRIGSYMRKFGIVA